MKSHRVHVGLGWFERFDFRACASMSSVLTRKSGATSIVCVGTSRGYSIAGWLVLYPIFFSFVPQGHAGLECGLLHFIAVPTKVVVFFI